MLDNMGDHTFQIISHVDGSNAQSVNPLLSTLGIAPLIAQRIVAELMRKSVDLNGQRGFVAEEV